MKKNRIVPLSAIGLSALIFGLPVVDAKTYTQTDVKEFAKFELEGEVNYDNVYIVGRHMFKNKLGVNDIMTGSRTLEKEEANVIYLRDTEGNWSNAVTGEEVTLPENFEIQVADYVSVEDAELKAKLDALKETINAKVAKEYTEATWSAVEEALAMVENTDSTRQAKLDALTAADNNLVYANLEDLTALLEEVNAKVAEEYTEASWAALQTAKKLDATTYEEIADKIEAINTAKYALVYANLGNLTSLLEEVNAKVAEEYTEDSWTALQIAVELDATTYEEIADKIEAINTAKDALVYANLEDLTALKEQYASLVASDYTAESYTTFTTSLEKVSGMSEESYAEIANKITAYETIASFLVKETLDTTLLEAAINAEYTAGNLTDSAEDYTEETWNAYVEALEAAKTIKDDTDALQSEIDSAVEALASAKEARVFSGLERLNGLKAEAEKLVKETYTEDSYQAITDALEVLENYVPASNSDVVLKADAIENAIANLVEQKVFDAWKTASETALEKAAMTSEYTEESRNALTAAALEPAEKTNDNYKEATSQINEKMEALVFFNQADLDAIIETIDALVEQDYTDATWAIFKRVYNSIIDVVPKSNAEVVAKAGNLTEAVDKLEVRVVTVDSLQEAIDAEYVKDEDGNVTAELILAEKDEENNDIYVTESWNAYIQAIADAKDLVADSSNSKQSDLEEAANAIKNAKEALVLAKVPTLQAAIDAQYITDEEGNVTEELTLVEADYSKETWAAYTAAISAAKKAINAQTNAEIQDAIDALNDAKTGLVLVKVATLQEVIDAEYEIVEDEKVLKLEEADYTPETWEAYYNALTAAEAITDPADNDEIQAAIDALNDAKAALVTNESVTALSDAKTLAATYAEAEYTRQTYQILIDAMAMTEENEEEIQAKTAAITAAISQLIPKNQESLDNLIQSIHLTESEYTAQSWKNLQDAIQLEATTYAEVNTKISAINSAKAALVFANKAELDKLIANTDLTENQYTAASWATLLDEIDIVRNSNVSTYANINSGIERLKAARKQLVANNKTDLDALEEVIESLVQSQYTTESWTEFKTAYDKVVLPDGTYALNAKRIEGITAAMNKLVATNQEELDALLDEVTALVEDDYTEESWNAYTTAYSKIASSDITYPSIATRINAIKDAMALLVEAEETPVAP